MAGTAQQALTTAAVELPNHPCRELCVNNDDASIAITIGYDSTTQLFKVAPGTNSGVIHLGNTNKLWVKAASGTPTCSFRWD